MEALPKSDRKPAVAGTFYPANKPELEKMLSGFFRESQQVLADQPIAVIVPHAGYIFSGSVAAAAYRQIDPDREFSHVFIIGSSHTSYFDGAAVYSMGDFITPMGKVSVDSLAVWLDSKYEIIHSDAGPHIREHSLEVQLPFLQYWLKKPFNIVPIIIGGESAETSKDLAAALEPFFNEKNLFVISTDFSHYPAYHDAAVSDKLMADAVAMNDTKSFLYAKSRDESAKIPNLMTAMCGWTSVLTLLNITEKMRDLDFTKIIYKNSGDSPYGDKVRVVGYNAIAVTKKAGKPAASGFHLIPEEKTALLKIAREALHEFYSKTEYTVLEKYRSMPGLNSHCGAFVTLTENGKLRGCIGNMQSNTPLYDLIPDLVISSATRDYRFDPVTINELPLINIEISILTPMRKIESIDEIELGRHGIYIRKNIQTGTFLPQVAITAGWTKEEFLGHCAQDKAHIGWDGWKSAEIFIYETLIFSEKDSDNMIK